MREATGSDAESRSTFTREMQRAQEWLRLVRIHADGSVPQLVIMLALEAGSRGWHVRPICAPAISHVKSPERGRGHAATQNNGEI